MRRTTLASIALHGAALLWVAGGLHANPPRPAQPAIEIAFLSEPPDQGPPVEAAETIPELATPDIALAEAPAAEAALDAVTELPGEPLVDAPPAPEPSPFQPPQLPRPVAAPRPVPRAAPSRPATARAAPPGPTAGPPAPEASAPAAGAPARAHAPPPGYVMALFAALERRKEYPESARWRRAEGVALLRVALRRDGSVIAWRVERSSGHADLDASLERMVLRASPLPAPPPEILGEAVEFTVPVRFSLR